MPHRHSNAASATTRSARSWTTARPGLGNRWRSSCARATRARTRPLITSASLVKLLPSCRPACSPPVGGGRRRRSEEHTSELQSRGHLVCRLLLEKKKNKQINRKHKRSLGQ